MGESAGPHHRVVLAAIDGVVYTVGLIVAQHYWPSAKVGTRSTVFSFPMKQLQFSPDTGRVRFACQSNTRVGSAVKVKL
jgi:hypothetical protein